ncbi:MAG: molybdenum ABC transporter ATP-binding protein [Proteobacteria bacterium]|nr:molybdenum ABC transporter ATP-binding protein [Pseudomonadota bacterium]
MMLQIDVSLQRRGFRLEARFDAPTPGVIALFGRSGCGKSTLVNLVAGLIGNGAGRIALDGECWLDSSSGIRVAAERRRIGYVFQEARLFPHYSVRGNLLYGAPRAPRAGLFDDVVSLLGLAALLQRRPTALSGGERQRVALGRALLAEPRLLLLDEPLASLDQSRRDEVLPFLERLRDHFALPMVYVSHQFDEVLRLATHLVVMDEGRVAAAGEVGAVSLHPALRAIVGPEAVGAVIQGRVARVDGEDLATVDVGPTSSVRVAAEGLVMGQSVRLQLLARDLILATTEPQGLSVRNQLRGRVVSVLSEGPADLVEIDIDGHRVLSRVTTAATRELKLVPGREIWVLVKAVSVSQHSMAPG